MADDNTLDIQQTIGDVAGDFSKTVIVGDGNETSTSVVEATTKHGDVSAIIELVEQVFAYVPHLVFVTIYGLAVYAAVLLITKKIKGDFRDL